MTNQTVRIALAASLLCNMFACGVIGGGLWVLDRESPRPTPPVRGRPIRVAGASLPPDDRRRFEDAICQVLINGQDLQRTALASRRSAAALFTQPSFDKSAASALLEQARAADITLQSRLDGAAIEFAATLPADERTTLAEGLERGGPLRHPPP